MANCTVPVPVFSDFRLTFSQLYGTVLYGNGTVCHSGRDSVFDKKIHFEQQTLYQNDTIPLSSSISYIHTRKFQTFEFNIKKHSNQNFKTYIKNSNFIIIGEQFLHPITREVKNNKKSQRQVPRNVIDKGLQIFQDSILPQIAKYKNPLGTKVIILSAEAGFPVGSRP